MVFKGVVVELQYIKPDPTTMGPSAAQMYSMIDSGDLEINVSLDVRIPKTKTFTLNISFEAVDVAEWVFDWKFEKTKDGDIIYNSGRDSVYSDSASLEPYLTLNGDYYSLVWNKVVTKNTFGDYYVLNIKYVDEMASDFKNDVLEIKVNDMMRICVALLLLVPIYAHSASLFQDPRRDDFDALLETYDKKDVSCVPSCNKDNDKKSYIVAVLSLSNGYNRIDVPKNCSFAVKVLSDLWDNDINDAAYELSRMYYHGVCVDVNLERSKDLLLASANNNYVPSQKLLGKSYWREETLGRLYSKDNEKAVFWLSKSAASGDAESAAMISAFYRKGIYFKKDPVKSFYWINKAFNSKYGSGLGAYTLDLADFYENGYGTEQDLVLSYKFYDLSGTAGNDGKNRIAKDMTEIEIQEAIRQSRAWQEEHNTFVPSYYGLQHQSDGSYR